MGEHVLPRRPPASRRPWAFGAVVAFGLSAGFAVLLHTRPLSTWGMTALDDLGTLAAALLGGAGAAVACVGAFRSGRRRLGLAWGLVAAGVWAWAAGEAVWSVYELVLQQPVPFPSAADAGFLAMPVLAGAGLLLWPAGRAGRGERISALLDGVIIASALLLLSWSVSLGAAWQGGSDLTAAVIGVAYPLGDVLLASLAVLLLSRAEPGDRAGLVLLTGGVLALAVADTAFLYGTADGTYASGDLLDVGWVAGFLAIGVAGLAHRPDQLPGPGRTATAPAWPRLLLPYVPTTFATVEVFGRLYTGHPLHPVQVTCALVIFAAGLLRQFLALAENRHLLATVRSSEEQLRHQAFHDPLTGLPNRALFADRIDHALRLAARDRLPRSVLFVDLDDFKQVNDGLGHAAGDRVLMDAGARLRACVRDGDTVARIGGDEFAVLLEGSDEPPERVAERIVRELRGLADADGRPVPVTASIGIATHLPGLGRQDAEELLAAADHAMYEAKSAGKDRYTTSPTIPLRPRPAT